MTSVSQTSAITAWSDRSWMTVTHREGEDAWRRKRALAWSLNATSPTRVAFVSASYHLSFLPIIGNSIPLLLIYPFSVPAFCFCRFCPLQDNCWSWVTSLLYNVRGRENPATHVYDVWCSYLCLLVSKRGSRADADDKWAEYPGIHIVATEHLHTLQVFTQHQSCAAKVVINVKRTTGNEVLNSFILCSISKEMLWNLSKKSCILN